MTEAALKETIKSLEEEIESLREASRHREQIISDGYAQMDEMVQQLEAQRNEHATALDVARKTSAFMSRVLDTMSDVLIVTDTLGRISRTNLQTQKLLGYTEKQLLGRPLDQLFSSEELDQFAEKHERVPGTHLPKSYQLFSRVRGVTFEASLSCADETQIPMRLRWGDLRSVEGKKEGIVVAASDFREVRRALDSLEAAHGGMKLLLDNIDQGFVTIGHDGRISPEYSKMMQVWFGVPELDKPVWSWLMDDHGGVFSQWLEMGLEELVEDILPVEILLEQLPKSLQRDDKTFRFTYQAIEPDEHGGRLLVVVSDVTEALRREQQEAEERQLLAIFSLVTRDRPGFDAFWGETDGLVEGLAAQREAEDTTLLMRSLHTIKGNAGTWGLDVVASLCHELENEAKNGTLPEPEALARLHDTWKGVGARIESILGDPGASKAEIMVSPEELSRALELIEPTSEHRRLFEELSGWRLEKAGMYLERLARQGAAVSERVGKQVNFRCADNGVRLPDLSWESLWSASIHAIRNAIDHGIEDVDTRLAAEKSAEGNIELAARFEDGHVVVSFSDDGGGIDWDRLEEKAKSLGLPHGTHEDRVAALFADGVSTREEVSMLSGRGVGLAALKEACEDLGGSIEIQSVRGEGTTMELWVPVQAGRSRDISPPPESVAQT